MKLTWARLATLTKFDDGQNTDEVVYEIHGPLELDTEAQILYVGHMGIPMSQVRAFRRVTEVPCPECKEEFSNNTALGAHRRFAHQVLGKKSQAKV